MLEVPPFFMILEYYKNVISVNRIAHDYKASNTKKKKTFLSRKIKYFKVSCYNIIKFRKMIKI